MNFKDITLLFIHSDLLSLVNTRWEDCICVVCAWLVQMPTGAVTNYFFYIALESVQVLS